MTVYCSKDVFFCCFWLSYTAVYNNIIEKHVVPSLRESLAHGHIFVMSLLKR